MRIKVDEDLPPAVTERLREAGHDAARVVEQGMSGWKDPGLWEAVQREGRFLVALTELVLQRARLDDLARLVSVATPRGLRTRRPSPSPGAA